MWSADVDVNSWTGVRKYWNDGTHSDKGSIRSIKFEKDESNKSYSIQITLADDKYDDVARELFVFSDDGSLHFETQDPTLFDQEIGKLIDDGFSESFAHEVRLEMRVGVYLDSKTGCWDEISNKVYAAVVEAEREGKIDLTSVFKFVEKKEAEGYLPAFYALGYELSSYQDSFTAPLALKAFERVPAEIKEHNLALVRGANMIIFLGDKYCPESDVKETETEIPLHLSHAFIRLSRVQEDQLDDDTAELYGIVKSIVSRSLFHATYDIPPNTETLLKAAEKIRAQLLRQPVNPQERDQSNVEIALIDEATRLLNDGDGSHVQFDVNDLGLDTDVILEDVFRRLSDRLEEGVDEARLLEVQDLRSKVFQVLCGGERDVKFDPESNAQTMLNLVKFINPRQKGFAQSPHSMFNPHFEGASDPSNGTVVTSSSTPTQK